MAQLSEQKQAEHRWLATKHAESAGVFAALYLTTPGSQIRQTAARFVGFIGDNATSDNDIVVALQRDLGYYRYDTRNLGCDAQAFWSSAWRRSFARMMNFSDMDEVRSRIYGSAPLSPDAVTAAEWAYSRGGLEGIREHADALQRARAAQTVPVAREYARQVLDTASASSSLRGAPAAASQPQRR